MSEWKNARKISPPDPGMLAVPYLVILESDGTTNHCKCWGGMGVPEIATYHEGWTYPWNARGSLRVAYWMELPKFNKRWDSREEGQTGEWV